MEGGRGDSRSAAPSVVQGQGEDLGKPFVMMADTQQPLPVTTLSVPCTTVSFNPQQSPYKGKQLYYPNFTDEGTTT